MATFFKVVTTMFVVIRLLKGSHQALELIEKHQQSSMMPSLPLDFKNTQISESTSSHILCKSDKENTYFYQGQKFLFQVEPWVGLVISSFFFTLANLLLVTCLRCSYGNVLNSLYKVTY
jgi:hypothetical protein